MKRIILIILAILLSSSLAMASPFLICDPETGVTHYKLTGPPWVQTSFLAQPDGSIRMDVFTSLIGLNSLTVSACKTDATWGELCSDAVPFDFTRPTRPGNPGNLKLLP